MLWLLGRTSDVRIAQYETEARIPKQELVEKWQIYLILVKCSYCSKYRQLYRTSTYFFLL